MFKIYQKAVFYIKKIRFQGHQGLFLLYPSADVHTITKYKLCKTSQNATKCLKPYLKTARNDAGYFIYFKVKALQCNFCCFISEASFEIRVRVFVMASLISSSTSSYPANNAMQGPCEPCEGCPYGNRTDLAAGAVVAPHGLTVRV